MSCQDHTWATRATARPELEADSPFRSPHVAALTPLSWPALPLGLSRVISVLIRGLICPTWRRGWNCEPADGDVLQLPGDLSPECRSGSEWLQPLNIFSGSFALISRSQCSSLVLTLRFGSTPSLGGEGRSSMQLSLPSVKGRRPGWSLPCNDFCGPQAHGSRWTTISSLRCQQLKCQDFLSMQWCLYLLNQPGR